MEKPKQGETPPEKKPAKEISTYINEFGQIVRDVPVEEINTFLDENVPDKKLDESETETDTDT